MTGHIHGEVTLFGVLASGSINIYNLLLPDPHMLIILPAQQFRSGEHQLKHSTHNQSVTVPKILNDIPGTGMSYSAHNVAKYIYDI